MTAQLAPLTVQRFVDNNGNPLAGGLVYTYAAGMSTPQATYVDSTQTTQNTNPITLNARGEAPIWFNPALAYKINVTDSQGNQVPGWPIDNVPGGYVSLANLGLTLYPQTAAEINAGITPNNYLYAPGDVRRYGAVIGTDCSSAVTTAASCNGQVTFPYISTSAWVINSTPTIPAGVILYVVPGATFSGTGAANLGFNAGLYFQLIEESTVPSDFATAYIRRNANHTGGSNTRTESALRVESYVSSGVADFEWALCAVLFNSATGGQNVALQGTAFRQTSNSGPTFASNFACEELVAINNPANASIGCEIDVFSNGTDASQNRVILHLVGARQGLTGTATTTGIGLLIDNSSDGTNSEYGTGILLGNKTLANCTFGIGLDMGPATFITGAIRIPQSAPIHFDASSVNGLSYDGTGLVYKVSNVNAIRLNASGTIGVGGSALPLTIASTTSSGATGGAITPPAQVLGYLQWVISGTTVKIPYYSN